METCTGLFCSKPATHQGMCEKCYKEFSSNWEKIEAGDTESDDEFFQRMIDEV